LRIFRGYDAANKRIYYSEVLHGVSREADNPLVEFHNRHKAGLALEFQPKLFKDFIVEWIDDRDDGGRECTVEHCRQFGNRYLVPAFGKFTLTDKTDVAIQRLPGPAQAGLVDINYPNAPHRTEHYLQTGGEARTDNSESHRQIQRRASGGSRSH